MAHNRRVLGGSQNKSNANIELTPLIDVVFIFFVLTASFISERGVAINRPNSAYATPIKKSALALVIDKSGGVSVAGSFIRPNDVHAISAALKQKRAEQIIIQADRDVPTYLLLQVLDTCKQSGAKQVDVAALKP